MNRNLRGALWALGGAVVGFIAGNQIVYGVFRIQPGDRTDVMARLAVVILFAAVAFWWGRRPSR